MVAPPGSYKWTAYKRHIIHLCFSEFKLNSEAVAQVFQHIFSDWFSGNRLKDEWCQRRNPTRCRMWVNVIDKPENQYTCEEQADRHRARGEIREALRVLSGLNMKSKMTASSTTPPTSSRPEPSGFPSRVKSVATDAMDCDEERYDGVDNNTKKKGNPPKLLGCSGELEPQVCTKLSHSSKQPNLSSTTLNLKNSRKLREETNNLILVTRPGKLSEPLRDPTADLTPLQSNDVYLAKMFETPLTTVGTPSPKGTGLECQLGEKDVIIRQQQDTITHLRKEIQRLQEICKEEAEKTRKQYEQSNSFYQQKLVSDRLVKRMFKAQTTRKAQQKREKDMVIPILHQAQHAQNTIDRLIRDVRSKDLLLSRQEDELRLCKSLLNDVDVSGKMGRMTALTVLVAKFQQELDELTADCSNDK